MKTLCLGSRAESKYMVCYAALHYIHVARSGYTARWIQGDCLMTAWRVERCAKEGEKRSLQISMKKRIKLEFVALLESNFATGSGHGSLIGMSSVWIFKEPFRKPQLARSR